jgi:predicted transcriptional regulator
MKTTTSAADSTTYTVRVPTPLKKAFDSVAILQERNGSQLLREFMRDYVQRNAGQALTHEDWFRQQVEKTRASIKAGRQATVAADDVHAWLDSWGTEAEKSARAAGLHSSRRAKSARVSKPKRRAKTPA